MKPSIILFSLICATIKIVAQIQIPNGGFENWTNMGSYETPVSWSTLNGASVSSGTYTCEQGTPGNPGSFYLKLTSKKNSSNVVVQAIAVYGTLNTTTIKAIGGYPFTQRPVKLTGSWQYMSGSTLSRGYINVQLTRWDTVQHRRDTVASLQHVLTSMVMSWTNFSLSLTYSDSVSHPDTCTIVLAASSNTPMENDFLYIDNLGFDGYNTDTTSTSTGGGTGTNTGGTGTNTGVEQQESGNINIFPNPVVTDEFTINTNKSTENAELMIYNIAGTLMKSVTLNQNQQKVNVEGLKSGCYLIVLQNQNFIINRRLIIQRE